MQPCHHPTLWCAVLCTGHCSPVVAAVLTPMPSTSLQHQPNTFRVSILLLPLAAATTTAATTSAALFELAASLCCRGCPRRRLALLHVPRLACCLGDPAGERGLGVRGNRVVCWRSSLLDDALRAHVISTGVRLQRGSKCLPAHARMQTVCVMQPNKAHNPIQRAGRPCHCTIACCAVWRVLCAVVCVSLTGHAPPALLPAAWP